MVRALVRGAHPGAETRPGPRSPAASTSSSRPPRGRARRSRPSCGASTGWWPSRREEKGDAARLRVAAEGALLRRGEEPARTAEGDRRRHRRGHPHRRHAAEGPRGDAAQAARRAHHHAGVALPDAHLARARDVRRHRVVHRRRDPRGGAHQARRAPGAHARAPPARVRPRRAAHRPVGHAEAARGGGAVPGRRAGATARWWTPACASRSTWRSACRWRTCASRTAPTCPTCEGDKGATRRSIWPAIYPELLELVQAHRSTIIFVNARRGAERLAVRLNELAGEEGKPAEIARAHHGSLAREERLVVEDLLKSGELPCLVATSSLELGIDMGAVDLVLQVESPKSVTAGLQRIGRAGHNVGDVSKGRIFPKFRADLLECAVVARRMRDGEIETTVVPRNPLDVLAQQIVAMVATGDDWRVPELHELVKRAYPYAELSPRAARQRARHARRPLPLRRVLRAAPADRVGPGGGHDPRAQGRAPAGGDQRGHDPRPRPVRRAPARRPPRGRAGRGDGLRGARRARRSCSAPRPGGSRRSPATA